MSFLKNGRLLVAAVVLFVVISGFKFLQDKFVIGFKHPESAFLCDNYIYVSNIGSSPTSKKLDGFITKLDEYGNILEYKFIDNLQAPKGIWVNKGELYIADLDRVCIADIDTKKMKCEYVKGSKFLNDIIYYDDAIYVTDTITNTVYKIKGSTQMRFFHLKGLSPNGIIFSKKLNAFIVVSFNRPVINIISLQGKLEKRVFIKGLSGFDGVMIYKNSLFLSDYRSGEIVVMNLNFKNIKVLKRFNTPAADIFVGAGKIIAPLLEANKLYISTIKQ